MTGISEPHAALNEHLFGGAYKDHIGWVNLDQLKAHREWDRSSPHSWDNQQGHGYSPQEWDEQQESVRNEGIKNPLILHYNKRDHRAVIGEGNHRLVWAENAGHKSVPVRVVRDTSGSRMGPQHSVQGPRQPWPKDEWFPADLHPRQVLPSSYSTAPKQGREIPEDRLQSFFNDRRKA